MVVGEDAPPCRVGRFGNQSTDLEEKMSIRREIVKYVTTCGGKHTNASLSCILGIPEPSVRRATREAAALGDLRMNDTQLGFVEYSPVPVPAPSEPTAPAAL